MSPSTNTVDQRVFYGLNGAETPLCHFASQRRVNTLVDELRRPHLDVERDLIAHLRPFVRAEESREPEPAWLVHAGCSDALRTFAIAVENRDHVADSARSWARPAGVSL
jgi:hypothetical protein